MRKRKRSAANQKQGDRIRVSPRLPVIPRVAYEPRGYGEDFRPSVITLRARKLRKNPTPAERRLYTILWNVNGGALRRRFQFQHVISGTWIADFFFPEVRLAIEVDGRVHEHPEQRERDRGKEPIAMRHDVTIVRVRNKDVFGDREALLEKLRDGYREALRRKNKIVGRRYVSPEEIARRKRIAALIIEKRRSGSDALAQNYTSHEYR